MFDQLDPQWSKPMPYRMPQWTHERPDAIELIRRQELKEAAQKAVKEELPEIAIKVGRYWVQLDPGKIERERTLLADLISMMENFPGHIQPLWDNWMAQRDDILRRIGSMREEL